MSEHNGRQRLKVYELLARDLKNLGVTSVFGLMSDDTVELAVTLDAMGVRFHGARHENNAVSMAEGYAAATGGLGVALIGRGPATANGLKLNLWRAPQGNACRAQCMSRRYPECERLVPRKPCLAPCRERQLQAS